MDISQIGDSTKPFMPDEEVAYLEKTYQDASVILEYGSGGTTRIAASLPGKFTMSVESDPEWARTLQQEIDAAKPASPAVIYYSDIGPVGPWGRPLNSESWRHFFRYPLDIWDEPFFRHPDTILIDGRLRNACMAMILLRCTQPVTVLFDDYGVRPLYQEIEKIVRPSILVGRLARFDITPDMTTKNQLSFLTKQFAAGSLYDDQGEEFYHKAPPW
jgi:hypothetical protein